MTGRLDASARPAPAVAMPGYVPEEHGTGIVHIGVGAFHKAHQAVYTDTALGMAGGDWRITGVSLRSADVAAALEPQNGRYMLLLRGGDGDTVRLIGSIASVIVAPRDPGAVIAAIADPATRVITLTVTEKAYGIDRATGGLDHAHEAIAHDLANRHAPAGVIGFLFAGLARRMADHAGGVTVLCCDNLPENGAVVARLVDEFARRIDRDVAEWIGANVTFPSSMVDRITPAPTDETLDDVARIAGLIDRAAVETEPFSQWIVEDEFAAGRPAWEQAGVLFVEAVSPYEKMKLRMLNGAHSLIAYAGHIAGYETVAEAMRDEALTKVVARQMIAAAATLPAVPGIDLDTYGGALLQRFANPRIRHLTYQIAMDGSEKLPQRILAPAGEMLQRTGQADEFAFALAAWMRYCLGVSEDGRAYALRDPRESVIASVVAGAGHDAGQLYDGLADLFPAMAASKAALRARVTGHLRRMLDDGMRASIEAAAQEA
jgi:fructuronate reductase